MFGSVDPTEFTEPDEHGWMAIVPSSLPRIWIPRALCFWRMVVSIGGTISLEQLAHPAHSLARWPAIEQAVRSYLAQSARSCDFGHLGEHVGNGLVVVDDRPCEERRSAPIRERRYEPWRFEWGSDRLLEPEFFGHRVRDRQSGDGTTGIGGSA
jgi:hypothetical protein